MYIRDIQRAVYRFAGTKGSFSSLFIQQKFNLSILPFFPLKIYSSVYLEKKKKRKVNLFSKFRENLETKHGHVATQQRLPDS